MSTIDTFNWVHKGRRAKGGKVTVRMASKDELAAAGLLDSAGRRKRPPRKAQYNAMNMGPLILPEKKDNAIGCPRIVQPVFQVCVTGGDNDKHVCTSACEKRLVRKRGAEDHRCGRTDYHHHDEAFGGGMANGTMGTGGRPRKTKPCAHTVHIHGCSSCWNVAPRGCEICDEMRLKVQETRNAE